MTSLIAEFRQTEAQIEELTARLKAMQEDPAYRRDIEFVRELEALMEKYDRNPQAVVKALFPEGLPGSKGKAAAAAVIRRSRRVKLYKNPHNNEVIETRGGNHKTLKEWKNKWGADEVESWATIQE